MLQNLYWNQTAAVRVNNNLSSWNTIQRGVWQGCVASSELFNICSEMILREIEDLERIRIGGVSINNIRHADDTALIASSSEDLQCLKDKVVHVSAQFGITINCKKTKCLAVSKKQNVPDCHLSISNQLIEQKTSFNYLGSIITQDGRSKTEVRRRITTPKTNFQKLKTFFSNKHISIRTKFKMLKNYTWPVLLYASETWTITPELYKI